MWYKVAGEGHLAPELDWASVVGLAGADFVGLDLDLEAPEAQGEGVTEISYFIMRGRGVSNQKLHNKYRLLKNDQNH